MQNKKNPILVVAVLCVVAAGCSKEFLDTTPPTGVSVSEYFNTPEEVETGIIACYDNLSAQVDRLHGLGVDGVGNFCGDIAQVGYVPPGSLGYDRLEDNTQDGSEGALTQVWNECYAGIFRCNLFLRQLENLTFELPAAQASAWRAEALFLRALYHFTLVQTFGDVPLVTEVLAVEDSYVPRDDEAFVLDQIILDFTTAALSLPLKDVQPADERGRATSGAARAYAMKAEMWRGSFGAALAQAEAVLASGQYDLHPNLMDNFDPLNDNGIESIFEVQCVGGEGGEGNAHSDMEAFEGTPNPRGWLAPRTAYMDMFDADGAIDPRRDQAFAQSFISPTLYASMKYNEGLSNGVQFDATRNFKLLRFADFLLLAAECRNETGDSGGAMELINRVRQRPGTGLDPVAGLDQQGIRDHLFNERALELGLEGHRFFDLVRWGIAGEVIRAQGRTFVDGQHERMPIPIAEMQINDALTQNPGY